MSESLDEVMREADIGDVEEKDKVYSALKEGFNTIAEQSLLEIMENHNEWGTWFGRIANVNRPQDYVEINITGYSMHHEITYEMTIVHENETAGMKSFSIDTDIMDFKESVRSGWKQAVDAFDGYLKEAAEVIDTDIHSPMRMYSPYTAYGYDDHYEALRQNGYGKNPGEYTVASSRQQVVRDYRRKTEESYHEINGLAAWELENAVWDSIQYEAEKGNLEIRIVDVVLYGSRSRGMEHEGSDLDFVVEYEGDIKEDYLFNLLNKEESRINNMDIPIDINPIRAEETGTLTEYLPKAEAYLEEKRMDMDESPNKSMLKNIRRNYEHTLDQIRNLNDSLDEIIPKSGMSAVHENKKEEQDALIRKDASKQQENGHVPPQILYQPPKGPKL